MPDAENARAAQPNDLGALQLLQKIQTRLGLTERAARTQAERVKAQDRLALMNQLNKEISRHPEDPKLVWKLGQAAWEGGSFLLASRCFDAALALDPNFQQAHASLEALRAARPELVRAPGRTTLFPPEAGSPAMPSVPSRGYGPGRERWGHEPGAIHRGRGSSPDRATVRLPASPLAHRSACWPRWDSFSVALG